MYAVLREELAALIAHDEFVLVLLAVSFLVGLLDATAAGGVVACNGKTHYAAVAEFHRLLHKALAEGTPSHDGAAVVVLNGTGKDFAGTGTSLIHQHYDG